MKKILLAAIGFTFVSVSGSAFAEEVRDWRDLDKVHKHVLEAAREMDAARSANHYDMEGHGAKAEMDLKNAERELNDAVEAMKSEKAPERK